MKRFGICAGGLKLLLTLLRLSFLDSVLSQVAVLRPNHLVPNTFFNTENVGNNLFDGMNVNYHHNNDYYNNKNNGSRNMMYYVTSHGHGWGKPVDFGIKAAAEDSSSKTETQPPNQNQSDQQQQNQDKSQKQERPLQQLMNSEEQQQKRADPQQQQSSEQQQQSSAEQQQPQQQNSQQQQQQFQQLNSEEKQQQIKHLRQAFSRTQQQFTVPVLPSRAQVQDQASTKPPIVTVYSFAPANPISSSATDPLTEAFQPNILVPDFDGSIPLPPPSQVPPYPPGGASAASVSFFRPSPEIDGNNKIIRSQKERMSSCVQKCIDDIL